MNASKLALFGGPQAVPSGNPKLFAWPIITREDEKAVLEVLRRGVLAMCHVWVQGRHGR